MPYVDGFVLPLAEDRIDDYAAVAGAAAKIWREHGALAYWECVGDDLVTDCSRTFPDMVGAGDDETVVFAWAVFESRDARDAANEAIMADSRMAELMERVTPLVDFGRMAHGGFRPLVHGGSTIALSAPIETGTVDGDVPTTTESDP